MATNINIKDLLHPWQKEVFKTIDKHKYNVAVIHRRAGKTVLMILYLLYRALKTPKRDFAYIWPYTNQVKEIAWAYLKNFASQVPDTDVNNTELRATFANWSRIRLFGSDNPDSMRWLNISGAILDEYAQINPSLFGEILFPMINFFGDEGFAIFIGTPKGYDSFYDIYKKAQANDKWSSTLMTVEQTGTLSEEDIEEARSQISEVQFQQEYMCNFDVAVKGSYYWEYIADLRQENRLINNLYDKALEVNVHFDLWMDDATSIIFSQVHWTELRVVDYEEHHWRGLEFYVELLRNKNYKYWTIHLPHDANVRELWTGTTRLETFRRMMSEEDVQILPRLSIMDWINAVREAFPNIYWESRLDLDLSKLSLYEAEFDEKKWIFKNKPKHDDTSHLADAVRYMCTSYNNMTEVVDYIEPFTQDYNELF